MARFQNDIDHSAHQREQIEEKVRKFLARDHRRNKRDFNILVRPAPDVARVPLFGNDPQVVGWANRIGQAKGTVFSNGDMRFNLFPIE